MFFIKKNFCILFYLTVLIFSIFRGFIVLFINNSNFSNVIYGISTSIIISLSFFSFIHNFNSSNLEKRYLRLLFYNLVLHLFYLIIEIIFNSKLDISIFNYTLVPYLIFIVIKIPDKYLILLLIFSSALYSGFTFYDFYISNFLENKETAVYYQHLLRPTSYEAFSMTGEFVRPGGILGSAHDSGNVFGIMTVYFFCMFILEKKYSFVFIFLFFTSIFCLLLSQSASNILACFFVLGVVFCFFVRRYTLKLLYSFLFLLFIALSLLTLINNYISYEFFSELFTIWTSRTSSDGDWEGMVNGFQKIRVIDLFHFFIGHASISNSNFIHSEVAFVKILFDIGIIGFIYLFMVITYPLRIIFFNSKRIKIYPPFFSILFCIVSLIHYGSLFRIPNILFLIILSALIYKQNIKTKTY